MGEAVAEAQTEPVEGSAEQADADLQAGFEDTPDPAPKVETPETPEQTPETPAEPEYVQVTKADFTRLLAAAEAIEKLPSSLDQRFGSVFGKFGPLEEKLKTIQAGTPQGQKVEVTDEDMAELIAEYPEFGGLTKKVLNKVLSRITGTGKVDPNEVKALIGGEFETFRGKTGEEKKSELRETMDALVEDWPKIIGLPDEKGVIPDTPYRRWLATQPKEYQEKISSTWNPFTIRSSIRKFQADTKPKPKQPATSPTNQRERMASAVQPKGQGPGKAAGSSPEEELQAGFDEA